MNEGKLTNISIVPSIRTGEKEIKTDSCYYGNRSYDCAAILCAGLKFSEEDQAVQSVVNQFQSDYEGCQRDFLPVDFFRQEAAQMDQMMKGLGASASASAVVIQKERLYWMSVGDCKVYIKRGSSMISVTRIHNYRLLLDELLEAKKITRDRYEAEAHKAEELVSFLGKGSLPVLDLMEKPFPVKPDDLILICNKSIYTSLTQKQIQAVLEDNEFDLEIAGNRLTKTAKEYDKTGSQTYSAMLLSVKNEPEHHER